MKERERSAQNLQAWNSLYGVAASVWGEAPIGFLPDYLPRLKALLNPESRLLDAATGEGRNLRKLLELPGSLFACDGSERALAKIPADLRARVSLTNCDLERLPFPERHFDLALLADTVETLPDPSIALREIARVLKPGGHLLCNIPDEGDGITGFDMQPIGQDAFLYQGRYFFRFMSEGTAGSLLEGAGFRVVSSERKSWMETEHPGFRTKEHQHESLVYLAQKMALN